MERGRQAAHATAAKSPDFVALYLACNVEVFCMNTPQRRSQINVVDKLPTLQQQRALIL
jgi:hypothetical protein